MPSARRWHRTVASALDFAGVGLHSGKQVCVRVAPPATSSKSFQRDNGGAITFRMTGRPPIRASVAALDPSKSMLCTQLRASDDSWRVSTVEHLMAALVAARVTHADIEIVKSDTNDQVVELPILDGSALPFVEAIRKTGTHELKDELLPASYLQIQRPVQVLDEDKAAWFLPIPSELPSQYTPSLHVSVQVNYSHKELGSRFFQFSLSGEADENLATFERVVAPARTFTFEDEIAWMRSNNLAKGGSLDNAIVFSKQQPTDDSCPRQVLNPEGLRFPADEWVRHKLLDCVGDLGLVGMPVHGYFVATSPGHALTHRLIQELFSDPANYSIASM